MIGHRGGFRDRREAGRQLGASLAAFSEHRPIVLGLPRGGVPVADEVARELGAPLDVIVVRKLGLPLQPELGFGAIGEGGTRILDTDLIRRVGMTDAEVSRVEQLERSELTRRIRQYRGDNAALEITGRTVVIVDDGLATGGTARVAVDVARARGARRVVVAVPVAPMETVVRLREVADDVICLLTPPDFLAVGRWYDNFDPTPDDEVARIVQSSLADRSRTPVRTGLPPGADVVIPVAGARLDGTLTVPADATGIVVFAHGSGSGRLSPRNSTVARTLHAAGLGTLLFDLLTPDESDDRDNVFDVPLLGSRLVAAADWLGTRAECNGLPTGSLGASTGAGAAIWAAGHRDDLFSALVSRGGRPDLASAWLPEVRCPTLLVVGGSDPTVIDLNRNAATVLTCPHRLVVVGDAGHLFAEPGALETVAQLAADWFSGHLRGESGQDPEASPRIG